MNPTQQTAEALEQQQQQPAVVVPFLEHQSFDHFSKQLFGQVLQATRLANALPPEEDFLYYASFRPFRTRMRHLGDQLLDLTQEFITHESSGGAASSSARVNSRDDPDDVTDRYEAVIDVVDTLLERVDSFEDELKGQSNAPKVVYGHTVASANTIAPNLTTKGRDYYMFHGSNVLRPQLQFKDPVDNSNTPWIPHAYRKDSVASKIKEREPKNILPKEIQKHLSSQLGIKVKDSNDFSEGYPHPYADEISNFEYLPSQLESTIEQRPPSFEETPFTWIETERALEDLANVLEKQREFAIDLEHHSYRSFEGFVCLMQISTRTEDYIIDTLALRHHMHVLASSFHDPRIVKVLHGSDSDIVWLQRDFGLYIINMFDTGQACRVLEYPSFALSYLLKQHCDLTVDKKYQLADWRIRPLPAEMILYARQDTHYLLYIYDKLRNELIGRGNMSASLVLAVLNRSRELCLRQYEKTLWTPTAHLALYNKFNYVFNPQQMRVFYELYKWRDFTSREEDESIRYVLPNHMLFHIAELMPTTSAGLLACCNPVPPLVRLNAETIVNLVTKAREEPMGQATATPTHLRSSGAQQQQEEGQPTRWDSTNYRPLLHSNHLGGRFDPVIMAAAASTPSKTTSQHPQPQKQTPQTPVRSVPSSSAQHEDSPVLSKDELYSMAGWEEKPLLSTATENYPRRQAAFSPLSNKHGSSLFNQLSSSPSLSSLASGLGAAAADINPEDKKTVELICATIKESSFHPSIPFSFDEEDKTTTRNSKEQEEAEEEDEDPLKDVPRSLKDIYSISNQNRKRNKEKRKLKEESKEGKSKEFSPLRLSGEDNKHKNKLSDEEEQEQDDVDEVREENEEEEEDEYSSTGRQQKKRRRTADQTDEEFLHSIGWKATPPKKAKKQQQSQQQSSSSHLTSIVTNKDVSSSPFASGKRRNNKNQQKGNDANATTEFVPYDYEQATNNNNHIFVPNRNRQAPQHKKAASFNPFSSQQQQQQPQTRTPRDRFAARNKAAAKMQTFGGGGGGNRGGRGGGGAGRSWARK
ncbi:Exosome component 10 [Balamuthia mandrillaris]